MLHNGSSRVKVRHVRNSTRIRDGGILALYFRELRPLIIPHNSSDELITSDQGVSATILSFPGVRQSRRNAMRFFIEMKHLAFKLATCSLEIQKLYFCVRLSPVGLVLFRNTKYRSGSEALLEVTKLASQAYSSTDTYYAARKGSYHT